MITRPDSPPGPAWMRNASEMLADPAGSRQFLKWFWVGFAIVMVLSFLLTSALGRAATRSYESPTQIAGMPLLAYGAEPRGIIAVGGRACGVIAVGGVAVGAVAIGGLALGGIAFGGLSLGLLAIGGGALGWWAIGGGAAGYYALGGGAVGGYAYAGNGVALGYHEAGGGQKERLFG